MESFVNISDDREKAILLWIIIAVLWMLSQKQLWKPLLNVLKAFLKIKILVPIFLMLAYTSLAIYLASNIKISDVYLWERGMLKDTIIWFFSVGMIMLFSYGKVVKWKSYFKEIIFWSLGLAAIIGFITNVTALPFLIEFLLVIPALFTLGMLLAYSGTQKELALVHNIFQWIIFVIVLVLLIFSILTISRGFQDFATLQTLRGFLLPLVLAISIIPIVYLLALYSRYEQAFLLIGFRLGDNKALYKYTRWELFRSSLLNLGKVDKFIKVYIARLGGVKDKSEIDKLFSEFLSRDSEKDGNLRGVK